MAVTPLQDFISAALARQSTPLSSSSAQVSSAVTPTANSNAANTSAVVLSPGASLQTSSLVTASASFAQLSSLLEVAQDGAGQISDILQQLLSLAQQGGNSQTASSEFQQLLTEVNLIAGNTSFNGASLLNGSFAAPTGEDDSSALSLPDLTTQGLFGSNTLSLGTGSNSDVIAALNGAQDQVNGTSQDITGVQSQLSFALANVDTALANSTAASSTLSDNDLTDGAQGDTLSSLLGTPGISAQAQTGNLSETLLGLVQE